MIVPLDGSTIGAVEVPTVDIPSEEPPLPPLEAGLGAELVDDVDTGVVVAEGCGLGELAMVAEELERRVSLVVVVNDGVVLPELCSLDVELSVVVLEGLSGDDVVGAADVEDCISAASAV